MYKNMVGLEAEFLLRDGEGKLVFPEDHGFGYDEWPILAEIRGDPADNTPDLLAACEAAAYELETAGKLWALEAELYERDAPALANTRTGWSTRFYDAARVLRAAIAAARKEAATEQTPERVGAVPEQGYIWV